MTGIELRLSDIDPPASEPHRTIYGDIVNLPDPLKLSICVRAFNYDEIGLYMQLEGAGTGWTFSTVNLGLLGSGSAAYYLRNQYGERAKPSAEISEPIVLTLKAYTDSGYSNLKWTFERTVSIFFIKSDDGSWTLDVNNDFDDGTKQGWDVAGGGGYSWTFINATDYVLSEPYSIRYYSDHTSSSGSRYERFYKSFTTPNKNMVFAIADFRHRHSNANQKAVEVQVNGVKTIYCGIQTPDSRWMRLVFPLPSNEADVLITIGNRHYHGGYDQAYIWMDDFRIISKD